MPDLSQLWGGDVQLGTTGDLATASGTALTQQRILRRLLTNPGDYIWQPSYGAGLPRFVGTPAVESTIEAVIRGQMALEPSVAQTPEAAIEVRADFSGSVYVHIRYVDASSGGTQALSFSLSG